MLKISKIFRFRLEAFHSGKELHQGLMETFAFLSEPKATTPALTEPKSDTDL
tara:strand:- start:1334 stop:1489 length:156 start_codon:yes stop_codon:yes gene_type:complete